MCAAAVRRLRQAGYRRIYLQTDDWRQPALALYFRLGFIPFLYTPNMKHRWQAVCTRLKPPFTPERWQRSPRFATDSPWPRLPWRLHREKATRQALFRTEPDDFLPECILDFPVHIFNPGVVPPSQFYSCAGHPMAKYDLDDLRRDLDAGTWNVWPIFPISGSTWLC